MAAKESTRMIRVPGLGDEGEAEGQPVVRIIAGPDEGRSHGLKQGTNTVGRSDSADIELEDDGVSRWHAEIKVDASGDAYIRDLGSTNGTLLNKQDLGQETRRLKDGDEVALGPDTVLVFLYL